MWCDFTILANTLKYLTILDKTWKRSARFDRYACDVTWRRLVSPLAGLDSRCAAWSTYVSSDASPRAQNMTMMHILLKIKEHLFHKGAHFFATSVSLLDCLVAVGLAKIWERNYFFYCWGFFMSSVLCLWTASWKSEQQKCALAEKTTFGRKHGRLWPRVCPCL